MTSLEALKLSEPLEATYINLEHDLLVSIAKQLGSGKGINSATEWRIRMLAQLGAVSKQNIYFISGAAKTVPKELETAFMKSIDMTLDWLELDKDAQKSFMNDIFNGKAETSISSNMMNALKSYEKNAVVKLNQVNTVMKYKADSSYVNAVNNVFFKWTKLERIKQPELVNKQDYLNILNTKTAHVVSGSLSHRQAVKEAVLEMCDKGIPAFIDKSGREWSPEAYIAMDIRTTVNNTARQVTFGAMEQSGKDIVEISSHADSRPLCEPYQGRFYSISGKSGVIRDVYGNEIHYEPLSSTSYGEPGGLFGINCGHEMFPVSDGLFAQSNFPTMSEKEKDEAYEKYIEKRAIVRDKRNEQTKADCLKATGLF